MSEQNKSNNQYETVLEIIKGGYAEINRNHRMIYDYIGGIKETEPGKAAGLELMILERVPQDNSILKEMERLKKIVMDSMKKEGGIKIMSKKQKRDDCPSHDRKIEHPVDSAEVKIEADGWVYFYQYIESYGLGLFKARPDGSDLTLIVNSSDQRPRWSNLRNLEIKDGLICFAVSIEYSEFDEAHCEYNRYRDDVTYKVQPDGENLMEVSCSRGYLGSSN